MGNFRNGLGEFDQPYGIAIGQNNDIYVADWGNGRIQKINANDEFTIFAGPGNADGQFGMPKGIAIDAAGNIYVSDKYKYNIQKLPQTVSMSPNGALLGLMTGSLYGRTA